MIHREQQLKYCKICKNKDFDPHRGIICSLTSDYPTFEKACENFDKDWILAKSEMQKEQEALLEIEKEEEKGLIISDIRSIIGIIVLIFLGYSMFRNPNVFNNFEIEGRKVIINSTLSNIGF